MKKKFLLLSVLAGLLVVGSACTQSQPAEAPPPQKEGTFRVEVSRNGFNKTPGEFRLEVEEGQEVEITFVYGDNDFPENNPHIIAIPDLGISPFILDRENPEETVNFTASKVGEVTLFPFTCTNPQCVGHTNLLGGVLVIQEEGHGHEEGEEHD